MRNFFNKILLFLTSLVNGSCDLSLEARAEYGCPHANYSLRGTVIDETTKEPIKGASVTVISQTKYHEFTDNVQTDENGVFVDNWDARDESYDSVTVNTVMQGYEEDTTVVSFLDVDYVGGHKWYKGEKEKNITIEMVKQ